ncbi:hypothetical protein WN943_014808 [Citrus x changshan-huyou]
MTTKMQPPIFTGTGIWANPGCNPFNPGCHYYMLGWGSSELGKSSLHRQN